MTVRKPTVPSLFIVGAPKCGTTAWVEYLRTHPDIYFPDAKEHCYFASDLPNFRLTRSAEGYRALFSNCGDAKIVGEASAMYLYSSTAAEEIRKHNPEARILIFLRNQEDYLPSLHNQFLWEFAEQIVQFERAWRLSEARPRDTIPDACLEPRTLNYKAMGQFHEQVRRYFDAFPVEQVRVIWFEDWVANPRSAYLDVLAFLGLQDDGRAEFPKVNEGMTYRWRGAARLVVAPPRRLGSAARLLRRMSGRAVGYLDKIAWKLIKLSSRNGYPKEISGNLRAEIRRYYEAENHMLRQLFGDPNPAPAPGWADRLSGPVALRRLQHIEPGPEC